MASGGSGSTSILGDEKRFNDLRNFSFTKMRFIGSLLLGVIAILFLNWHEPGTKKQGRIVIDEKHSEWEKSDLPLTPEVFWGENGL